MKKKNIVGKRFGNLIVVREAPERDKGRVVWECVCDCGKEEVKVKGIYLTTGETKSCGCIKKNLEEENLRNQYDNKRVYGVAMPLFKDKEPRKDSSTGFRGVSKYLTRKSKEVRYRAWITVKGKKYYKSGFETAEEAYHNGRIVLENQYLPRKDENHE